MSIRKQLEKTREETENEQLDCLLDYLIQKKLLHEEVGDVYNIKFIERLSENERGKEYLEEARKSCNLGDIQEPLHNLPHRLEKRLQERVGLCIIDSIDSNLELDEEEVKRWCGLNKIQIEKIKHRVEYLANIINQPNEEFLALMPEEYQKIFPEKAESLKKLLKWFMEKELKEGRMLSLGEFIQYQSLYSTPARELFGSILTSKELYKLYTENNEQYMKENMIEITKELEHYYKELNYSDIWEGAEALERAIKEHAKPEEGKEVKVDVTEDDDGHFWLNIENEQYSNYHCFTQDMEHLKWTIGNVEYVTFDELWKMADIVAQKMGKENKNLLTDESTIIAIPRGGQIVLGVFALRNDASKSQVFPQFIPIELKNQIVENIREGKGIERNFEFKIPEEKPYYNKRYGSDNPEYMKKEDEKVSKEYFYRNLFRGGNLMTGKQIILLDDVVLSGQRMRDAIDSLRSIVGDKIPIYPVSFYGSVKQLRYEVDKVKNRERIIKEMKEHVEKRIKLISENTGYYIYTEVEKEFAIKNEKEKLEKDIEDFQNTHPIIFGEVLEEDKEDRPNIVFQWSIPDYTPIWYRYQIIPKEKLFEKKSQYDVFQKTKESEY